MSKANQIAESLADALKEMVKEATASYIYDLESWVENAVGNMILEVDASNVNGLESRIETVFGDMTLEVDASNVNGLHEEIERVVNGLELSVSAQNVDNLGTYVKEYVEEADIESSQIEGLEEFVRGEIERYWAATIDLEALINRRVEEILKQKGIGQPSFLVRKVKAGWNWLKDLWLKDLFRNSGITG